MDHLTKTAKEVNSGYIHEISPNFNIIMLGINASDWLGERLAAGKS